MNPLKFLFYCSCALAVFGINSCQYQTPIAAPTIEEFPGGVKIIPNIPTDLNPFFLKKPIKNAKIVLKSTPLGAKPNLLEHIINLNDSLRLAVVKPAELSISYLDYQGAEVSLATSTLAVDTVTGDIVIGRFLSNPEPAFCLCSSSSVAFSTADATTRYLSWAPPAAGQWETRRVQVTDPASGQSVTFIVYLVSSGAFRLLAGSSEYQPCLTTSNSFALRDDNRRIQYSNGSLDFSVESYLDTGSTQKLVVTCPNTYIVSVEKVNCLLGG